MSRYHAGASWGARKESIDACADRLLRFLTELSSCDAVFSRWYKLGMSRRKAMQAEIDFRKKDYLLGMLEKGRNRTDIGKKVIEELGFSVWMWNGAACDEKSVGLNVHCGSYTTGPAVGNGVSIDLPEDLGDLRDAERMAKVLLAVARCWEPDTARVSTVQPIRAEDIVPGRPVEGPKYFDWMVYVSNRLAPNPTVPEPSLVKPVDALGSLIIVQPEPVEADNPVHLQRVKAVEAALGIK
jgi:hypothetical protein